MLARCFVVLVSVAAGATGCDGCRDRASPADNDGGAAAARSADEGAGPLTEPRIDAGARLAERGAPSALARVDPACTGPRIDLAAAVVDPRCAIGSSEAKRLRVPLEVDGAAPLLRQEAAREDDAVVVRVVSTSDKPLVLPLSWHPKLPAFTALAEDDAHQLFELEAPRLVPPSAPAEEKAHFARVVLAPGAVAFAKPALSTKIEKRIVPSCPEGEACAPARLAPGTYTLHVGQLLIDVEAGAPARLPWMVR